MCKTVTPKDHRQLTTPSSWHLLRDSIQLIRSQYGLLLIVCFILLLLGVLSPLGALLGPILSAIHAAIAEKAETGKIHLRNATSWFRFSADGLLTYMMMLATCFLFLAPTSLITYHTASSWDSISDNLPFTPPVIATILIASIPSIAVIQLTLCVPFLFTFSILTREQCSAVEAIKRSISLTTNNLSRVVSFTIFLISVQIAGILLFVIPGILLLPVHFAMIHRLHCHLAKDDRHRESTLGDHLNDSSDFEETRDRHDQ